MQVEQDLDDLTDSAPDDLMPDIALPEITMDTAVAPREQQLAAPAVAAPAALADDPAEFLLAAVAAPGAGVGRWSPARRPPVRSSPTHWPRSRASCSAARGPIGTPRRPGADRDPSGREAHALRPSPTGPLAALMAMSEEERIALFS